MFGTVSRSRDGSCGTVGAGRGTSIEYTRTPAGRPGKYARHLLVSGQVNVKPLLTHELPIERKKIQRVQFRSTFLWLV